MKKVIYAAALGLGVTWLLSRKDVRIWIQHHFWDRFYDRGSEIYEAMVRLSMGWWERLQGEALNWLPPEGARILEVGFGTGRLHVELARRYRTAGIDLAPGMVAYTQKRLARKGLESELVRGSAAAMPWANATFDAVVSTFAFSAMPDAEAVVAEMGRVVKSGGRVIIVDAGDALDGNWVAWALARLWAAGGDFMRDERPYMQAAGLAHIMREDYGPFNSVHVTVGTKPPAVEG
jgi:ubiquinone/menaquinone biosynthesis C-methylase UbiE